MTNNKQISASEKLLAVGEWRISMHYRMAKINFAPLRFYRFIVVLRLYTFVISIPPLSSRLKWRDLFDLIVIDFSNMLRLGRNDRDYNGDFAAMRLNCLSLTANLSQFVTRKSLISLRGNL